MGDNFLEDQTDKCRKRRDRAMEEVRHPTLLDRPEIVRRLYDIKPKDGEPLRAGEVLLAQITGRQDNVAILRGPKTVGSIVGEGGTVLSSGLQETCGATQMRILSVLPLSGVGRAEIIKGDHQQ